MRPVDVVPERVEFNFPAEIVKVERDGNEPDTFLLEGPDESFDHGNGSVLPDRAESLFDVLCFAEFGEKVGVELDALIVDEMLGRSANGLDRVFEKGLNVGGGGFTSEHSESDQPPGEVIEDKGRPVGERERLGERERQPGHPEAGRGDHGQIGVPRIAGLKRFSGSRFNGCRLI